MFPLFVGHGLLVHVNQQHVFHISSVSIRYEPPPQRHGSNRSSPQSCRSPLCVSGQTSLSRQGYAVVGAALSTTGRISIEPSRADGILAAMAVASSRSFAAIRKKPPSCSRDSAKGPSVTNCLPSRTRTVLAFVVACN